MFDKNISMNRFDLQKLSNDDLILLYSNWIAELKKRKIVRTNNIVGDIGEYLAIEYYNRTEGLPNLIAEPVSTKCIDAKTTFGECFSIKTTTTRTTSAFWGVTTIEEKLFDKLLVVELDKSFKLRRIIEIDWDVFFKFKHWHSRMQAYNIIISNKLVKCSRIIYSMDLEYKNDF